MIRRMLAIDLLGLLVGIGLSQIMETADGKSGATLFLQPVDGGEPREPLRLSGPTDKMPKAGARFVLEEQEP